MAAFAPAHAHGPRLGLRVRVAVTKWRLDRELAAGAGPHRDDALALRAAQLVDPRTASRVACGGRSPAGRGDAARAYRCAARPC